MQTSEENYDIEPEQRVAVGRVVAEDVNPFTSLTAPEAAPVPVATAAENETPSLI
jgi:hypothetical protein